MFPDPKKQKFVEEIKTLDNSIARVLNVDVPADLENKLLLRQSFARSAQSTKRRRVHLALAASVVFALAATLSYVQFTPVHSNLGDYALAHVYHEADHFNNGLTQRVNLTDLNQELSDYGASFVSSIGEVIASKHCFFDGMDSLHLVLKGKNAPVNVFITPKAEHLVFKDKFADEYLNGQSIEFKQANVIIVGDKSESLSQWQQQIKDKIRFQTL